ncbi:hypothetical protein [Bradyrhizobium sp.]|uniref:hypothetical protein n=1 Tax=Bradyrhizobium sp. TaxID=376 RepID=UPI003BAE7761
MRQVEHLLAAWCRDQRVLVLGKGTAVGLVERIADRQAQNVRARQMQTQLAPQLARFLERKRADQVERQRRYGEGRNDVSSEVFLEPGDRRPGNSGEPVVTNSCAFYFAREAAGASGTRLSLRPLFSRGTSFSKTRANRAAGA